MSGSYRKGYVISDQAATYFLTMTVVEWLEVFIRPQLADIVLSNLRYCVEHKGLVLHAWCLMPNHLHLICTHPKGKLSDVLRDFKSYTSKTLYSSLSENKIPESRKALLLSRFHFAGAPKDRRFKLWQDGNHPIYCSTEKVFEQRLTYIHENPVRAGFVWQPEHYRYSSAIDYQGGQGLLPLVLG